MVIASVIVIAIVIVIVIFIIILKGELQKGSAQKVTSKSLKSGLHVINLYVISWLDPLLRLPFLRASEISEETSILHSAKGGAVETGCSDLCAALY